MEVASITGHKDLRMLQRYVQLRPTDLALKLISFKDHQHHGAKIIVCKQ
jgi:hypothetical protein